MEFISPHVRLKDIAKAAGCSAMTVSLALRNSHRISPAVRERIAKLAQEMKYRPDPFVSAFMLRRAKPNRPDTDLIAVLTKLNGPQQRQPRTPTYYSELWSGLEERGAELGFRLEEIPVYGKAAPTGKELTRILTTRGIRAVMLFPGGGFSRAYPELDWRQFSIVAAGFHAIQMPVHRVSSDYTHAIEIALAEVEKRGYRRAGLALTSQLDPLIRFGMSGRFLSWQQGLPPSRRVPFIGARSEEPDPESFAVWLRKQRPDIVLALDPHIRWMRDLAIQIQPDIGFINLGKRRRDNFAGVDLRTHNVGRAAIDILARELYLNRFGPPDVPEVITVSTQWEEGSTVRAPIE